MRTVGRSSSSGSRDHQVELFNQDLTKAFIIEPRVDLLLLFPSFTPRRKPASETRDEAVDRLLTDSHHITVEAVPQELEPVG